MVSRSRAFTTVMPPFRARPLLQDPSEVEAIRLTERHREELAALATVVQAPKGTVLYAENSPAQWVFAVAEGVAKAYRDLPSGRSVVHAFLFSRDLFGLAEAGRYVNSVRAVTDVVLYRLPAAQLAALLKHDGDLQYGFLAKVTHELRESQRRALILNRRDAPGRLAMFLALLAERLDAPSASLPLPMTRSDIAAFLGLTLETVSRAARLLEDRKLVKFQGRRAVRILDPRQLARLAAAV